MCQNKNHCYINLYQEILYLNLIFLAPHRILLIFFDLLSSGKTVGLFQLESSGMRDALTQMKPNRLEDIIALVALYRPGPMSNIPIYNDCKHGKRSPDYLHPKLENILKSTYGVIIYQEQVMQIAQVLSGFTAGEADILRRAMGKKKRAEL